MKKLFILIFVLATLGGFYYYSHNKIDPTDVEPGTVTDNTFHPDASSAIFAFDEGSVTLSHGKSDQQDSETILLDDEAYGDLNGDGLEDSIVLLAQSGGGSGTFIYAAAYVSGPVNYKGSNTIFLGDRISPQSLSISNGIATVKYLDRNPDEALASEPTVPATKQFIYKNGQFQER